MQTLLGLVLKLNKWILHSISLIRGLITRSTPATTLQILLLLLIIRNITRPSSSTLVFLRRLIDLNIFQTNLPTFDTGLFVLEPTFYVSTAKISMDVPPTDSCSWEILSISLLVKLVV